MSQWKGYGPDNLFTSEADLTGGGPQASVSAGALTYEPHYGLRAKPFSLSTDPRTLFQSSNHISVLNDLLEGIRRREGIIVLTGEMGTGKTTLCRAALYQLDRKTFATFVPDPFLSREDLLRMLLVDFGEVSVDDLRQGRLSGSSRPDLSHQLFDFLTSLESVDAFAVLVIDEAQHLAPPLLEEIRALSELEAGRRLLQIVLVGQPELQSHLKQPQMRQIDQRVTMRCELRPLTREDLAGYVAHRLAMAGGTSERIAFASAAIDMIHAASNGVPRLVNVICDRALSRGHLEGTSVIGPPLVAGALDELQMPVPTLATSPARPVMPAPQVSTAGAQTSPVPQGLFDRRRDAGPKPASAELHALLDLPRTQPKREVEGPTDYARIGVSAVPVWKWQADRESRRSARVAWLKNVGLAVLGMAVVLLAGGIAVTAQRLRPAAVAPQAVALPAVAPPVTTPQIEIAPETVVVVAPTPTPSAVAAAVPTWVVQVAAFASPDRSRATVARLKEAGFTAFELATDVGSRGLLYFVRVGPFQTAAEADEARARIAQFPELQGAFVRNVTTKP